MTPTFICVWVQGNVPYTAEYVLRLRSMVARHYPRIHRFVCLTDQPRHPDLEGIETIAIEGHDANLPGWWAKVQLFNPRLKLSERIVYIDLDSVIVSSLVPVVEFDSKFALVPPAGNFKGRGALRTVRRYNSSVMVWDNVKRVHMLHNLWTSAVAFRLWGDQDYIGEVIPDADIMPINWFPRMSEIVNVKAGGAAALPLARDLLSANGAKVVLCKVPKPHVAVEKFPWFNEVWR